MSKFDSMPEAEAVLERLARGEDVKLPGLGTLKVTRRAATTGRNLRTGLLMKLPARCKVKFEPGKEVRAAMAACAKKEKA